MTDSIAWAVTFCCTVGFVLVVCGLLAVSILVGSLVEYIRSRRQDK